MGQYSLAIRQHGQHQPSALSRLLLRFRNRLLLFAVPLLRPRNQTVYQCGCLQQYRFQRRCFLQYVRVLWEYPTSRSDETGDFWNFIVGAVVGAVVNAVSTAVDAVKEGGLDALSDGKTWAKIGVSAAGGLVSGALAASGVGLGASILGNTAISMAQNAANQAIDNGGLKSFDVGDMVIDGFIGGISAIPGGKGMKNTVKLDTLNKRLTKKLFSGSAQVAKQGIKYYYSQTKTLYKEYLIKPILKSAATAKILSSIT